MSSLPPEPDEVLVKTVAASHEAAASCRNQPFDVAALIVQYRPFLKAIAAAEFPDQLRSRVDDSDLVQETMLKATRQADQFRGSTEAELESWLRETLLNQIRDCVRFNGRQQRNIGIEIPIASSNVSAADPTASEEVRKAETRDLIRKVVNELPDDYRTVILLRQQLDLNFVEIAEQMNRSPDAVRMLWARAILVLGEKLKSLK